MKLRTTAVVEYYLADAVILAVGFPDINDHFLPRLRRRGHALLSGLEELPGIDSVVCCAFLAVDNTTFAAALAARPPAFHPS